MRSTQILSRSMLPPSAGAHAPAVPQEIAIETTAAAPPAKHSYGQILKSSALIGGSSVLNIAVSMVRAKAMALMLGPAGVGLLGLYSSILDVSQSIAGMGINNSGVRQIAEAAGTGDTTRIARTAKVLRRTSLALGVVGGLLLLVFCRQISSWTFGTDRFAAPVALLSVGVLLRSVSDGQIALIQGMRRIADLARIGVLAAVFGSAISLALVYFLREDGVVPSLVSFTAVTLVLAWWHRRQIDIQSVHVTAIQVREEAGALLKLGCAFMVSAVLTTGAAYAIRIIVRNAVGFEAAGLYQAAWSLGGLYVGLILQAMGSDFYPRLTAVAQNNAECNRLVNEQAQISLLLAGPGVIGTIALAPWVISIFYHSTFAHAVEPLRWICLGMALRVVAWPMGYIILARGARRIFLWTEIAAAVVHVTLALVLVKYFGLRGATVAFFGLYVWHSLIIYWFVHRLTGFRWSPANVRTGLVFLPLIGLVFAGCMLLPAPLAMSLGVAAAAISGVLSLRVLCRLVESERIPRLLRRVLA